ncbi:hypothetical protein E1301_Tti000417 [Triplophysa tibetana]|nr:hypothetical protein E1301_Tti000417 [Triplophysa tibetana]
MFAWDISGMPDPGWSIDEGRLSFDYRPDKWIQISHWRTTWSADVANDLNAAPLSPNTVIDLIPPSVPTHRPTTAVPTGKVNGLHQPLPLVWSMSQTSLQDGCSNTQDTGRAEASAGASECRGAIRDYTHG